LQLQTIESELSLTLDAAVYQPDRSAIEAWTAQIAPLSWSDSRIAPLARVEANDFEELSAPPTPDVCADMKIWAQSGYHVLSPASRAFEATQNALAKAVRPRGSINSLLKPYERSPERALIRQARALRPKIVKALRGALRGSAGLRRALGVPEEPFEERKQEPVLGRGTTHAGTTFIVRRETPGGRFGSSCHRSVSVELTERPEGSGGSSGSSSGSVCLAGRSDHQTSGGCSGEVQSIRAAVPASVRTVRLQLSDGQTITSPVIRVPRRYGGPGGIYVQAVRGYSPYPVSLTELDAQGKVVAVVKVGFRCRKEPATKGPAFVDLATGTTPDGEPFVIQAFVVRFGRGQTSFSLTVGAGLHDNSEEGAVQGVKPKAFSWSLGMECQPHEFAIVYGILSPPGDSVLARTPAGLVPLTKVAIAADLHSGGPLVYGVFSTLPSELVVLRSDGSTLYSESLATKGKEEAEFCAGYAEA
jgi:hypothetical protein